MPLSQRVPPAKVRASAHHAGVSGIDENNGDRHRCVQLSLAPRIRLDTSTNLWPEWHGLGHGRDQGDRVSCRAACRGHKSEAAPSSRPAPAPTVDYAGSLVGIPWRA